MNTPYGLQMVENCGTCKLRKQGWYCALSPDLLKSFMAFSHLTTYPGGAVLFVEGQAPRGGFVLCSGKVKLSTTSREGKVLILKIVQPGEIMGLSAAISGEPYEITAETVGPCLVNFIERDGLLRLMERNGELGLRSALAVSREFQSAYRDIHELVLAKSSLRASWPVCCSRGWSAMLIQNKKRAFKRRPRMRKWRNELARLEKPSRDC